MSASWASSPARSMAAARRKSRPRLARSAAINELERNERLHEDVLRYLTLRVDELEEGPSVMARGRKERSGRDRDDSYRARSDKPDGKSSGKPDGKPTESADKPAADDSKDIPAADGG